MLCILLVFKNRTLESIVRCSFITARWVANVRREAVCEVRQRSDRRQMAVALNQLLDLEQIFPLI